MADLPAEVWHGVCSHLTADDTRRLRLVCRALDDIASCYSLPDVTFYLHQRDFAALRAIADHSIAARNVKSLTYVAHAMGDALSLEEFIQRHRDVERLDKQIAKAMRDRYVSKRLTKSQLAEYHANYSEAVKQQAEVLENSLDFKCLAEVLPKFTSLEDVMMSAGHCWREGWQAKTPFDNCVLKPTGKLEPAGCRHLEALVSALQALDHKIQRLYAGEISWRFFERTPAQHQSLKDICSNLSTINIEFDTGFGDDEIVGTEVPECRALMEKGVLRNFLAALPRVQEISIVFGFRDEEFDEYPADLKDIIKSGHRWPDLKHLALCNIECDRQELTRTLELHRETLRVLDLEHISLKSTSWLKFLPEVRNKLDLEEALVSGDTFGRSEAGDDLREYWDLADCDVWPEEDNLRDDVAGYLTKSLISLPLSHSNMGHRSQDLDSDLGL